MMRVLAWRDNPMTGEQYFRTVSDIRGRKVHQEQWIVPEHTEKHIILDNGTGRQIRVIEATETEEKGPLGSYLSVQKRYDEGRRVNMFYISRGWYEE